jgi:hypothetical protein
VDDELQHINTRKASLRSDVAHKRALLDAAKAELRVCRQSAFESVLRGEVVALNRPHTQPRFSLLPAAQPNLRRLVDLEALPPSYTIEASQTETVRLASTQGGNGLPPLYNNVAGLQTAAPPTYSPVVNLTLVPHTHTLDEQNEEVHVQIQNSGGFQTQLLS